MLQIVYVSIAETPLLLCVKYTSANDRSYILCFGEKIMEYLKMKQSISELIKEYRNKVDNDNILYDNRKISATARSNNISNYFSEFLQKVRKIDKTSATKELFEYFGKISEKSEWNYEDYTWIDCVSEFPERIFIPYLIEILKIQDKTAPYFRVLTVLKYLPEEIGEDAVLGICEAISANNPFWTEYVFAEAFETLVFIGDEKGYEFIYKSCSSDVQFISQWAIYYRDNWLEDVDDDD